MCTAVCCPKQRTETQLQRSFRDAGQVGCGPCATCEVGHILIGTVRYAPLHTFGRTFHLVDDANGERMRCTSWFVPSLTSAMMRAATSDRECSVHVKLVTIRLEVRDCCS